MWKIGQRSYTAAHGQLKKFGCLDEIGEAKIFEIDKSLFFKNKYDRGCMRNFQCVLSHIERVTCKIFILLVENRNSETIITMIIENFRPFFEVITDKLRFYANNWHIPASFGKKFSKFCLNGLHRNTHTEC